MRKAGTAGRDEWKKHQHYISRAFSQESGGLAGERGGIYVARRGQLKFIMSGNRSRACTHLGTRVPARYYD